MSTDLVLLAADAHIEQACRGLLEERRAALGLRGPLRAELLRHPRRDPGCYHEAHAFLETYVHLAKHALVVLDAAWEGAPSRHRSELEEAVEARLRRSWGDRAACVVIDPEVEAWVWSDSPEVAAALGWPDAGLRSWLRGEALWPDDSDKPPDPKGALERVLAELGRPRSAALFHALASRVGLGRCVDSSFDKLKRVLRAWFGARGGGEAPPPERSPQHRRGAPGTTRG